MLCWICFLWFIDLWKVFGCFWDGFSCLDDVDRFVCLIVVVCMLSNYLQKMLKECSLDFLCAVDLNLTLIVTNGIRNKVACASKPASDFILLWKGQGIGSDLSI